MLIIVNNTIVLEDGVVFQCGITLGPRHQRFDVKLPWPDIPENIEEKLTAFIRDFSHKQKVRDARHWDGFEIEL